MRPEVNSKQFEISNRFEMLFGLHGNLHGDFTEATFQLMQNRCCAFGCFLNNSSKANAHELAMILRNFILLWPFTALKRQAAFLRLYCS